MGRVFLFVFLVILGFVSYFVVVTYQDTYRVLPGDLSEPAPVDVYREWRLFTPESGAFAVLLPVMPNMTQDRVEDPNSDELRLYDIYVAEKNNGTVFIVNMIRYPDRTSVGADVLQQVKPELLRMLPQSKLLKENHAQFHGRDAIEVDVENPAAKLMGKAFTVDNTLYVLSYMTDRRYFDEEEYQYFLDSFRIYDDTEEGQ